MSINLLPWREQRLRQQKKHTRWRLLSAVILTTIWVVGWQLRNHLVVKQQNELERKYQTQLSLLSPKYTAAQAVQKQQKSAAQDLAFLKNKLHIDQYLLTIFAQLADKLPSNVYLTALTWQDSTLYFYGKAPSHLELSLFLKHMAQVIADQPMVTESAHSERQSGIDFTLGYKV